MSASFRWQLVGSADVRRVQGSSTWLARDLKAAVGRAVGVAPRWLEVSWRARRLADDERVPAGGDGPAGGEDARPLLVSLVLPRFARTSTEACPPRSRRKRVTNQAAVTALADEWQPGLHRHELDEDEGASGEPGEPDEGAPAGRRPCYPVFVSGLLGFPSPLLRLDLGCAAPTVGMLRKLLLEVTGTDMHIAFRGQRLGGARQYLHRLGLLEGGTVCAEGLALPGQSDGGCARASAAAAAALPAVEVCEELALAYRTDSAQVGRKRTAVLAGSGGVFSGSSRKKTLSSGECGPRGPGGQPSLLAARPLTKRPDADSISRPADSLGGFEMEDSRAS
jgi:hypothetical protein